MATNGANPLYNNRRYYTWSDDLHIMKGKHTLRAGVWFQRVEQNQYSSGQANAGTVSYPTLLAFLQDAPTQFIVNPNPIPLFYRSTQAAWYIQDEIKLKPNLTLRLGLRKEMTTGWNEANGRASNYDLDRNGVILTEPFTGHSALLENNARALWQPRVGVAWDPSGSGRWAVRAGFGIHHDLQDNLGIRIGANPPFNARLTIQGQPLLSIIPIIAGTQPPPSCTARVAVTTTGLLHLRARRRRSGYAHPNHPAMEFDGRTGNYPRLDAAGELCRLGVLPLAGGNE